MPAHIGDERLELARLVELSRLVVAAQHETLGEAERGMDQAFHGNEAFHVESEDPGEMSRSEKKRTGKRMGVCVSCCCIFHKRSVKTHMCVACFRNLGGIKSRDMAKTGSDIWEKWAIL